MTHDALFAYFDRIYRTHHERPSDFTRWVVDQSPFKWFVSYVLPTQIRHSVDQRLVRHIWYIAICHWFTPVHLDSMTAINDLSWISNLSTSHRYPRSIITHMEYIHLCIHQNAIAEYISRSGIENPFHAAQLFEDLGYNLLAAALRENMFVTLQDIRLWNEVYDCFQYHTDRLRS